MLTVRMLRNAIFGILSAPAQGVAKSCVSGRRPRDECPLRSRRGADTMANNPRVRSIGQVSDFGPKKEAV
jgi:hypothetical protein